MNTIGGLKPSAVAKKTVFRSNRDSSVIQKSPPIMEDSKVDKSSILRKRTVPDNKVYKEDSESIFGHSPLARGVILDKNRMDKITQIAKAKSADNKRHKPIHRIKSMPMDEMRAFVEDPRILSTNYLPGAGRKPDTIYNRTLSLLCNAP